MLFSIVICTYNRCDHLLAAVQSVFQQSLQAASYEVIVVDNCSTDDTPNLIQSLMQQHPNVRYLFEDRLGLATARNTGWQAARGTYVAFLDDDAKASDNWLETALALLSREDLNIHCVGGPIHPFYLDPQPDWWKDRYEIRTRGDAERHLRQGEFFSGSNMIWRKQTLEQYGGFETKAGMKGTQLGMGEETSLFRRIWEAEGSPIFLYSPRLLVYHWVPAEKMTMWYIVKRALAAGQFEGNYTLAEIDGGVVKRLKSILSLIAEMIVQFPRVALKRWHYTTTQNWFFEHCYAPIQNVGKLLRLFGLKVSVTQRK